MTRTVVIGGGIAGLATAALLARDGQEVVLFERLDRLGGRAGEVWDGDFRFETGPSWYLMPEVFDHFFALLGTSTAAELTLRTLDPAYRVFHEPAGDEAATVLDVPFGGERVRAVFAESEPGSGPAFDAYLESAAKAMDLAMRYFLYNPFTRPRAVLTPEVLRELPTLAPLLLRSLESHVAERFTDPVLRQVLGYPAVFLGTRPADAPSMYHLMSRLDLEEGVRYPMGGFTSIVDALERLARAHGVEIRTGAEVTGIETAPLSGRVRDAVPAAVPGVRRARVTGVRWRPAGATGERGHVEPADRVVSGADLHHTETRLLPPRLRTHPESSWERRVSGPGAVLVMLGVRGELPELPHHSLFFTRDWERNFADVFDAPTTLPAPASAYVCKPSATDPGVAPAGHENLFVLVPAPADPHLGAGGAAGAGDPAIEAAADRIIDQIAHWAGVPDLRARIVARHTLGPADFLNDYHSWRGGILGPGHVLSQSAMFRAQNESGRVAGLYYAGCTTAPGVGVPMCLISAQLVLKRMRGEHSAGPWPTPMVDRSGTSSRTPGGAS